MLEKSYWRRFWVLGAEAAVFSLAVIAFLISPSSNSEGFKAFSIILGVAMALVFIIHSLSGLARGTNEFLVFLVAILIGYLSGGLAVGYMAILGHWLIKDWARGAVELGTAFIPLSLAFSYVVTGLEKHFRKMIDPV